MANRDARSLPAAAQEELRRRAIHAVLVLGKKTSEVAKLFGVTAQAVRNWLKAHQAGGDAALAAQRRGRRVGEKTRLTPDQEKVIAELVRDRCPDQLKLPFYLWTREAVAQLIEVRFGVQVSVKTAGRYLARWGYTPQKPARRSYKQNPKAVERWLKEEYPAIQAEARKEGAQIHWCDESGMRSDHTAGRSYAPRGQTPVVQVTGSRFSCNMISSVSSLGKLFFMIYGERFTAQVFIKFLRRLLRQNKGKVFLIVDGHPVHRSKVVRQWVEKHKDRLRLFRLPSYSPELNPDELVNQDVKANAVGRKRARNVKELMENVRAFLRRKQRRPELVRRYFQGRYVAYAAQTI